MPSIIIIDRNSVVKPYNTKTFIEEELYKKAGFKSKEGFSKYTEWNVMIKNVPSTIELYGKTNGRAGQENKYDFPPPADNALFFGSCVIVGKCGTDVVDVSQSDWEKIYEQLFGGFDDIASKDSDDDTETDEDDGVSRTKEGYVKDGFIVDDIEDDDSDHIEYVEAVSKKSKSSKPQSTKPKTPKKQQPVLKQSSKTVKEYDTPSIHRENIQIKIHSEPNANNDNVNQSKYHELSVEDFVQTANEPDPTYFSCTDELTEEAYI